MADYYPVLARAIAGLSSNDARARWELYERARAIVIEQLRRRDPDGLTRDTVRERAALEAAIHKVEMEWRSVHAPADRRRAQPRPPERALRAGGPTVTPAAAALPQNTASFLTRILHALQPGEAGENDPPRGGQAQPKAQYATAKALPQTSDQADAPLSSEGRELGGMLKSLATMMLALTYAVAAIAFTGVVYFRGSIMVAAGIIGYPVLLLMTALVLCLFVVPAWLLLRKSFALPALGFLFRMIHTASRHAF